MIKREQFEWIDKSLQEDITKQCEYIEDVFLEAIDFIGKENCEMNIDCDGVFLEFDLKAIMPFTAEIKELSKIEEMIDRADKFSKFSTMVKHALHRLSAKKIGWRLRLDEYHGTSYYRAEIKFYKYIQDKQRKLWEE